MTSLSHWGMFELPPRLFFIPAGFNLSDQDRAEWHRADGWIEIVRQ